MARKLNKPKSGTATMVLKTFAAIFLGLVLMLGIFNLYFTNRIFPGVFAANVDLSGKSKDEARELLEKNLAFPEQITLKTGSDNFDMNLSELQFEYDYIGTATNAFREFRQGYLISNIGEQITSLHRKHNISLAIKINDAKLQEFIDVISGKIEVATIHPSVTYKDNKITVNEGVSGKKINKALFAQIVKDQLTAYNFSEVEIPVVVEEVKMTPEQVGSLEKRAATLIEKSLTIRNEGDEYLIDDVDLLSFLKPTQDPQKAAVQEFIEKEITSKINREPQNAVFKEEGGRVVEFLPGKKGVAIDAHDLSGKISEALSTLETSEEKNVIITATARLTDPKVSTHEVNNLGIKELLGTGKSNFKGSIPGRIHNVNHASGKLNGVLIAPGETASFNQILGDISQLTGYKQAYIIKDGKTILGDGGGVCQTSTTLFRAVLEAGLPIVERRAHAYRVGYYEQGFPPGLDATVFSPTTDFKFKNDTPSNILIQTSVDLKNLALTYEIYGTSDGRVAHISKPVTASQIAPPEDLYIDDPNLPAGKIEQTEHKAWGAKVTFDYSVERNGETIFSKTFVSNYRPWGAVYLRGTVPVQ